MTNAGAPGHSDFLWKKSQKLKLLLLRLTSADTNRRPSRMPSASAQTRGSRGETSLRLRSPRPQTQLGVFLGVKREWYLGRRVMRRLLTVTEMPSGTCSSDFAVSGPGKVLALQWSLRGLRASLASFLRDTQQWLYLCCNRRQIVGESSWVGGGVLFFQKNFRRS